METITVYQYKSSVIKHTIEVEVPEGITIDDYVLQIDEEDNWDDFVVESEGDEIFNDLDHVEVWHTPSDAASEEKMIIG